MKKYLIIGLIFFPLVSKASLMGFMDGQGLWDENGVQQYTCFSDDTCVGLDNQIYQKPALLGTVTPISTPATSITPAILPPVSIQSPAPNQSPIVAGVPQLASPYSEGDLANKFGVSESQSTDGTQRKQVLHWSCEALSSTSANCRGNSVNLTFSFNGQVVNDCSLPFCGAADWTAPTITGLTPDTDYPYQIIYSEAGRADSIFTKSFHTPGN